MSQPDEYKTIKDSFSTGFENTSNKELVHRHKTTDNEYGRQDISLEMNRRLIDEIKEFNENSSKQTNWVIGLTIAMLITAFVQIGLFIYSLFK